MGVASQQGLQKGEEIQNFRAWRIFGVAWGRVLVLSVMFFDGRCLPSTWGRNYVSAKLFRRHALPRLALLFFLFSSLLFAPIETDGISGGWNRF
jgi:hypothetical protein